MYILKNYLPNNFTVVLSINYSGVRGHVSPQWTQSANASNWARPNHKTLLAAPALSRASDHLSPTPMMLWCCQEPALRRRRRVTCWWRKTPLIPALSSLWVKHNPGGVTPSQSNRHKQWRSLYWFLKCLCLRKQSDEGENGEEEGAEEEKADTEWGKSWREVQDVRNWGRGGGRSGRGDRHPARPVTGDKVQTTQPYHCERQEHHPREFMHRFLQWCVTLILKTVTAVLLYFWVLKSSTTVLQEVITNEHVVAMMKAAINETEAVPPFVSFCLTLSVKLQCFSLLLVNKFLTWSFFFLFSGA